MMTLPLIRTRLLVEGLSSRPYGRQHYFWSTFHPSTTTTTSNSSGTSTLPDLDTLISSTLRDPSTSAVPDVGPRPQTKWERVQNFPRGVVALIKDCLQYKSIHDASKTPLNAWTINSPIQRNNKTLPTNTSSYRGFFVYEDEIRPGRIPRRQYEQQRQLQQDFRTMVPLVLLWIPPIVGFVPPLLAMVAPRQTMSRQFHNPYEIMWYNQIEYDQRKRSYLVLGDMFWSSFPLVNVKKLILDQSDCTHDEAGPIIDGMDLYSAFCNNNNNTNTTRTTTTPATNKMSPATTHTDDENQLDITDDDTSSGSSLLSSSLSIQKCRPFDLPPFQGGGIHYTAIHDLPRAYLVQLCLSIGVCQHLPGWMSKWMVELTPSFFLYRQVERISKIVSHDDALLLEEGHDLNGCESLTDQEVADACLLRGLPVDRQHSSCVRRRCLTNHLTMIANVKRHMDGPITDGFRLLTIHLGPLRYHLKMLQQQQRSNSSTTITTTRR